MMKLLSMLAVLLMFSGCAATINLKHPVNTRIKNIYSASVTIVDDTGRVYGSGTVIHNKKGEPMAVVTAAHVVVSLLSNADTINSTSMSNHQASRRSKHTSRVIIWIRCSWVKLPNTFDFISKSSIVI